MRTHNAAAASLLACVVLTLGFAARAQEGKKADPPKEAAAKTEAKKPAVIAFVGADIYTVTHGIIRGGTVVVRDNKIVQVGQDVPIPAEAVRVDAKGKTITPGFIAISASNIAVRTLGTSGTGPNASQGKFADALNPYDRMMLFCLGSGITTACVDVASGAGGRFGRDADLPEDDTRLCPCCGMTILPTEPIGPTPPTERTARRHAVIKLTYGDLSGMLVKESPFYHLPAGSFSGPMNRHQWRETIKRAKQQVKNRAEAEAASDAGETNAPAGGGRRGISEEVLKLVEKKIPLRTEAYSVEQIREAIALAKELDYNLVLDGVHEAWLAAGELGTAKVDAVITPRNRRRPQPGQEDTSGSSIETSAYLEKAGVSFAVAALSPTVSLDGIPGRDLTSLALEAAFAVRGGCSEQAALASLTITPARMLGLADRIGSIDEGKDADLLILDGPPLDYRTGVVQAYVGGKVYYDRNRDRIYPEPKPR